MNLKITGLMMLFLILFSQVQAKKEIALADLEDFFELYGRMIKYEDLDQLELRTLSIGVVDEYGDPVSGANLEISTRTIDMSYGLNYDQTTDTNGFLEIRNIPFNQVSAIVTKNGFATERMEVQVADDDSFRPLAFTLRQHGKGDLIVTLHDEKTSKILSADYSDSLTLVRSIDQRGLHDTKPEIMEPGKYIYRDLPAGKYGIAFSQAIDGWRSEKRIPDVVVEKHEPGRIEVHLTRTPRISVYFEHQDKDFTISGMFAVLGYESVLIKESETEERIIIESVDDDVRNMFTYEDLEPGQYTHIASINDRTIDIEQFDLKEGEYRSIEITAEIQNKNR